MSVKMINDSRKLLGAPVNATLKDLNTLYKGLMKKHHPDRFQDPAEKTEAEAISQELIEAYKFLESIHPETHVKNSEDLEKTLLSMITNWQYKAQVLTLHFGDGSSYEFFGVQPKLYNKFATTDGTARFVRRNIIGEHPHRRLTAPRAAE